MPSSGNYSIKTYPGSPEPRGVSRTYKGINFSVFSKHADTLHLLIFGHEADQSTLEVPLDPKYNRTKDIWHIEIEGLPDQFEYGYRTDRVKKKQTAADHFNPQRILNDPYARAYSGGEQWGKRRTGPAMESSRRSLFQQSSFDWGDDRPPNIPLADTIIYELHVRGFTRHPSSNVTHPGTFSGLIEKIPYLKSLGITAVELLPINEFDESQIHRLNPVSGEKLFNFWGYDSLGYFTPKASYAAENDQGKQVAEFKSMVKEFHKAGIEVILDIVFNHTGEGERGGPTFSFRGLDNSVYYMTDRSSGQYQNFTGCGNTVNCNHPTVQQMILDSLCYWVAEMHVDGFRFDLASILSRREDGSVMDQPPVLDKINKDPILSQKKLIAEAWDAAGLYQVGSFPGGKRWAEWNDKIRDNIRRYIRGDKGHVGELATRIAGSSDLFQKGGRAPYHSINFITCHDGFTLNDLVSYDRKHNKMNGENNRDGMNENFSSNHGEEGPSKDSEINFLRMKQIKNMVTLLLISQGVPMILAGDEFGRTQQGNNNPYCQDNKISWVNWELAGQNDGLLRFFKHLIQFRKTHPALNRRTFFDNDPSGKVPIHWYKSQLNRPDWSGKTASLAFHLLPVPGDTDIFVMSNSEKKKKRYLLPILPSEKAWILTLDTALTEPEDINAQDHEKQLTDQMHYRVEAQSTVVLISK